jgi:GntR family transcriptional regulator/MocR family aminotransferase
MTAQLRLKLDRAAGLPLSEQIRLGIAKAIESGLLAPGARLPSWRDLAAQLGVARGTVRVAYERLTDAQLIEASKATGTRVLGGTPRPPTPEPHVELDPLPLLYRGMAAAPYLFQMGVPAPDIFPTTLFARIRASAVRAETASPGTHPDPRGEPELRREIAAHLAISRGIVCRPAQVFITGGFSGGLGVALLALGAQSGTAWAEDPGFPISRRALEIAGLKTVPIPVDSEGIDVAAAIARAPQARLALVTPGQQAPLGPTLSLARRTALLEWAARNKSWIIEDDYLGELQLNGRAAPALAAIDAGGRVIHIGSFSKTISPTLRLGFVMVPPALAARFAETLSCLAPAPGPAVQKAAATFMQEGHYMRHLRRLKRTYAGRRDMLRVALQSGGYKLETAGLAMLLHLPTGTDDVAVCRAGQAFGIGPAPLSPWYSGKRPQSGLLLSVATAAPERIAAACARLKELIRKFG